MSALKTLWAWIAASIAWARWSSGCPVCDKDAKGQPRGSRDAHAEGCEYGDPALAQGQDAERELAQDQDHCDPPARRPGSAAQSKSAKRDAQSRSLMRILIGPRIDGGTSWTLKPPRTGWPPIYTELIAAVGRGSKTIELTDLQGEVVTWRISWREAGGVVLEHGYTRIEVSRRRAEIQIKALAAEVEGVRSWYLREIPRAAWWLLGIDVEGRAEPGLYDLGEATIAALDDLAPQFEQRRLEICADVQGGIALGPGIDQTVVGRLTTWLVRSAIGKVDGLLIGQRHKNPLSMGLYDKQSELEAKRGPAHGALLERLREAGLVEGVQLLRVELRLWGKALVLEGLDARRPSAALDEELLGKLWAHGLTQVRLVDPDHPAKRWRDKAEHPAWTALRDAGGHTGPLRLTRVTATAQLESTVAHARDRLAQAGADVEELLPSMPGDGEGDVALRELGAAIDRETEWDERRAKAAARYEALLESVREAGS